jgi:glycosyltransferase involved in cell wall biosynthesis
MHLEDLRLGFVSDRAAFVDDGLWVDSGVGRVLEVWAGVCRRVTIAMTASPQREPFQDMRLSIPVENYLPLPWLPSIARGFHKVWGCRRVIREIERRSDMLIVQLPFAAPLALLDARRPRLYHLCANIHAMASTSNAYEGFRRLPAVIAGRTIDRIQRRLVHSPTTRVVTNGDELLAHYDHPPGCAVVSTTIQDREILSVPRRRPADAPFRVLYVGYLRRAKGIDTLVEAFERVLERVPGAELVIVGPRDTVDHGMTEFLAQKLQLLSRKGTVRQLGHLAFGPELFQQYADADVLALPSRSEGTPRVLVEARAFGCPVIGTRVGGIPTSITNEVDGLLVPPNDPAALGDAIVRVASDRQLRDRLVAGGVCRARASTVEAFVQTMATEIDRLMAGVEVARQAEPVRSS